MSQLFSDRLLDRLRTDLEQFANLRLDAGETAAFARELEHVYAQTYDIRYPELKARRFIPIDTSVSSAAERYVYRQWGLFGMAKLIANFADDLPRVDALAREFFGRIKSLGASYGWSIQDLRRSAQLGTQLDQQRARAARRAHEQAFDEIMAFGHAPAGLLGFLDHPNIPIVAAIHGQWISQNRSPMQMVEDLNHLVNTIVLTTKELWAPDTLILPNLAYQRINSTPMSLTGDTTRTVKNFWLENSDTITGVYQWGKCNAAGAGGVDRTVCYKKSNEVLEGVEPQAFEQFPPQPRNLEFVVPTHSRVGGVKVTQPLACAYMDDLGG